MHQAEMMSKQSTGSQYHPRVFVYILICTTTSKTYVLTSMIQSNYILSIVVLSAIELTVTSKFLFWSKTETKSFDVKILKQELDLRFYFQNLNSCLLIIVVLSAIELTFRPKFIFWSKTEWKSSGERVLNKALNRIFE